MKPAPSYSVLHQRKSNAISNLKTVISTGVDFIPGSSAVKKIGTTTYKLLSTTGDLSVGDTTLLHKILLGEPGQSKSETPTTAKLDMTTLRLQVLEASGDLRPKLSANKQSPANYPGILTPTGRVKSYEEIVDYYRRRPRNPGEPQVSPADSADMAISSLTDDSGIKLHGLNMYGEEYANAAAS